MRMIYRFEEMIMNKKRADRIAQQKSRGGKRSFVTEIENLQIIIAWLAGEISEGIASKLIGIERIELRKMRDDAIESIQLSVKEWRELNKPDLK